MLSGTTLYVGGTFTTANGSPRVAAAAFDATNGALLAWDPGLVPGGVRLHARLSGSTVYLGGMFSALNGGAAPRDRLAAVDATTGAASGLEPGRRGPGLRDRRHRVDGLRRRDFGFVNGSTPRSHAAAFDRTTGAVTAWNPNLNGTAAWAVAVDGGNVYLGGDFTAVNGGTARSGVARVDATTGVATSWSPNVAVRATSSRSR